MNFIAFMPNNLTCSLSAIVGKEGFPNTEDSRGKAEKGGKPRLRFLGESANIFFF